MLQPYNIAYARKSLIVHIKAAHKLKFPFFSASYISTPTSQRFLSSFISSCIYTFNLSFRFLGPGTNTVKNIYSSFMHSHGSKLYSVKITSHDEYCWSDYPKSWKPSVHGPSRTLWVSTLKEGHVSLKAFHAGEYEGWCIKTIIWTIIGMPIHILSRSTWCI